MRALAQRLASLEVLFGARVRSRMRKGNGGERARRRAAWACVPHSTPSSWAARAERWDLCAIEGPDPGACHIALQLESYWLLTHSYLPPSN